MEFLYGPGEPEPPPAMPKPRCESCCLGWDAVQDAPWPEQQYLMKEGPRLGTMTHRGLQQERTGAAGMLQLPPVLPTAGSAKAHSKGRVSPQQLNSELCQ